MNDKPRTPREIPNQEDPRNDQPEKAPGQSPGPDTGTPVNPNEDEG
jgi:hypothetical protein